MKILKKWILAQRIIAGNRYSLTLNGDHFWPANKNAINDRLKLLNGLIHHLSSGFYSLLVALQRFADLLEKF